MELRLARCTLRPFRPDDAPSLVRHANSRAIWQHLRDAFPHPYTLADAHAFLAVAEGRQPPTTFAVDVDGAAVGGIGVFLKTDIERVSAEMGYWLGEAFWGRGVMTEAVQALTHYAVETHHLTRVFAVPFADNHASCRVLEKAGYVREGVMRRSALKEGRVRDQALYAWVVEDDAAADSAEGFGF